MLGYLGIDIIKHGVRIEERTLGHRAVLLCFLPGSQDFSFEFLFMFICVLSLLFTPTYAWYSHDRLNSTGLFICMLTVFTCALGFFLQLYSICWQNAFYTRRRKNLILKAERSRLALENSQR